MNRDDVIEHVMTEVKKELRGDSTGHDWWHIYRVWNWAKIICTKEGGNSFVVELAALLHDIADWKFHGGDESIGPAKAKEILLEANVDKDVIESVVQIVATISYKGAGVADASDLSLEAKVVQDADRLDSLGAIGIARTFAYGGATGRSIYDPGIQPVIHDSSEAYKANKSPSINHFYEKLLLLVERMNTQSAKDVAQGRHEFLQAYLDEFFKEWNGKA